MRMNRARLAATSIAILFCSLWVFAQTAAQAPTPPPSVPGAQGGPGRGQGRGGGRGPRPRKTLLIWADTRNGQAQHDSVSHAMAVIERLGYESGVYDSYIRTDSRVGADVAVVDARLIAQALDDGHRVRDRVVLRLTVTGVRPDEKSLPRARSAPTAASLSSARTLSCGHRWWRSGRLCGGLREHPKTAEQHGNRRRGQSGSVHPHPRFA